MSSVGYNTNDKRERYLPDQHVRSSTFVKSPTAGQQKALIEIEREFVRSATALSANDNNVEAAALRDTAQLPTSLVLKPLFVRKPIGAAPQHRFELLQQWQGVVESVGNGCFSALLQDKTDPTRAREEGEFPLSEVAEDDLPLVKEGAVFYWSIGYDVLVTGRKTRASTLRFRRLPAWSQSDVDAVAKRAAALKEMFGRK